MRKKLLEIEYLLLRKKYIISLIFLSYMIFFIIKDTILLKIGLSNLVEYILFSLFSPLFGFFFRLQLYLLCWFVSLNKEVNFFHFDMDWANVSMIVPVLLLLNMIKGLFYLFIPVSEHGHFSAVIVLINFGMLRFALPSRAKDDVQNKLKELD